MNDNAQRATQWQRLVGEFFPPILGGAPQAWAEANRIIAPPLWDYEYVQALWKRSNADFAAFDRAYQLEWLWRMCDFVGIERPPEEKALELTRRAADYITRRVRSAFFGVVEAIRDLHAQGYTLHTASGGPSYDLESYLEGMGVRDCFRHLYGPDLVNTLKDSPLFYERIFAHAGVLPANAVVIDDNPRAIAWAAQAGARTALIGQAKVEQYKPDLIIESLAKLPRVIHLL